MKEGGVRLDAAILNAIPSTTRAFVKDAIASGSVLISGTSASPRKAPKGLKLRGGETIVIRELLEAEDNLVSPEAGRLSCVFEDGSLLAFDKPAGMPSSPSPAAKPEP